MNRIFGSDYFGESKMGGLRLWNHLVYRRGGLALHSGLKTFPDIDGEERSLLVLGLSGTGKTTTTFRQQLGSQPVQDDFNALMPGGTIYTTEAGCFAKTYGLDPDAEPTIYGGTTDEGAWLESTHVDPDGTVDFWNDSYTRNGPIHIPAGRYPPPLPVGGSTRTLSTAAEPQREHRPGGGQTPPCPGSRLLHVGPRPRALLPAVPQRPARIFAFPVRTRSSSRTTPGREIAFSSCSRRCRTSRSMSMNTGSVGGAEGDERSQKVTIAHSSAIVEGIVSGTIVWERDDDFGFDVATSVPGVDNGELLRPREMYSRQSRPDEYAAIVQRLTDERRAHLRGYAELNPSIVSAI